MGHCGGSHRALRFYFAGQTRRRYVFRRSQYHRPAIVPFRKHPWSGQLDRAAREKHLQVSHPCGKSMFASGVCNAIFFRMFPNVRVYQSLQIISRIFQGICYHISAHSIAIVRITGLIITAFVFWMCTHIGQCAVQNVQSGRPHRHRLRLPCCAAAGSGRKIYPSVEQQKCADNGIKSKWQEPPAGTSPPP